ncbi:release factor glutamine methyltransferase [Pigmentiphaga litoralis]|uniref:peptide chain release factor N(5)-glutamine methyltransferase n=1 Tax=Pigmentiphaga litoralis TaxID=516702 RepID=UPI00167C03CC|nr:peptide chain release factor N(5)-glutamine methyltransferase [Pigmentiphaga litoralis]GGX19451.1 release factor glutamine methyltransferase [Pigmentiphaga litoralis]
MAAADVRALIASSGLPVLEARVLLGHALQVNRAWLIAHDTDPLTDEQVSAYQQLAERRRAGEPVAYLLGEKEFMGHTFRVTPSVLIPRADTEVLVETALADLQGKTRPAVLDMGTGSGAIAVSLALARPDADVIATDVSADALAVAQKNAISLGARVRCAQGSWFDALNSAGVPAVYDVIVSNPPYISSSDAHLDQGDLRFEPRQALTDFRDGLEAVRIIVAGAKQYLNVGGSLWLEHGWDQAAAVRELLVAAGFQRVSSRRDLSDIERISGGYL